MSSFFFISGATPAFSSPALSSASHGSLRTSRCPARAPRALVRGCPCEQVVAAAGRLATAMGAGPAVPRPRASCSARPRASASRLGRGRGPLLPCHEQQERPCLCRSRS